MIDGRYKLFAAPPGAEILTTFSGGADRRRCPRISILYRLPGDGHYVRVLYVRLPRAAWRRL